MSGPPQQGRDSEAITAGIDDTLNRAAEESRELTSDESQLVERDQSRAGGACAHPHRALRQDRGDPQQGRRGPARSAIPAGAALHAQGRGARVQALEDDGVPKSSRVSTSAVVSRSLGGHGVDPKIERATAHQMLADNPGIVPRPILAPVINLIDASRPFIQSIGTKALPAGSFDRPIITQHVAVGKQAAEKGPDRVVQKLLLGKLPVTAATYAGHLNISRQDIKWTQPGILQIVAEDFAAIYADETDADAVAQFIASLTGAPVPIAAWDAVLSGHGWRFFQGAAASLQAKAGFPDKVWVSFLDARLGCPRLPDHAGTGGSFFPSLSSRQATPVTCSACRSSRTGTPGQDDSGGWLTPPRVVRGRRRAHQRAGAGCPRPARRVRRFRGLPEHLPRPPSTSPRPRRPGPAGSWTPEPQRAAARRGIALMVAERYLYPRRGARMDRRAYDGWSTTPSSQTVLDAEAGESGAGVPGRTPWSAQLTAGPLPSSRSGGGSHGTFSAGGDRGQ